MKLFRLSVSLPGLHRFGAQARRSLAAALASAQRFGVELRFAFR
jgi:hypothetical protein